MRTVYIRSGLTTTYPHLALGPFYDPSVRVLSRFTFVTLRTTMLDNEFRKQRAQLARELAAIASDRFIKKRLLDLAARYEDNRTPATPVDLGVKTRGTGSER